MVQTLLAAGADVNATTKSGFTPLLLAARWGYEALVGLLLEHGAELITNSNGNDARGLAQKWGHEGVLRQLAAVA